MNVNAVVEKFKKRCQLSESYNNYKSKSDYELTENEELFVLANIKSTSKSLTGADHEKIDAARKTDKRMKNRLITESSLEEIYIMRYYFYLPVIIIAAYCDISTGGMSRFLKDIGWQYKAGEIKKDNKVLRYFKKTTQCQIKGSSKDMLREKIINSDKFYALDEKHQEILKMLYGINDEKIYYSQQKVAERFNLTQQRVLQIKQLALKKLGLVKI